MMSEPPALRVSMPVCPSTNNLYRGRRFKTDFYKEWIERAEWVVKLQHHARLAGRLRVVIEAPFNLKRDLDNIKPALDLLVTLGLIDGDNRIDDLHIRRVPAGGAMTVSVWPM